MKRKLQSLSLFHKIWLSHITVLIVPLLVLGYIGYKQIATNLYDQVASNNTARLSYLKENVDARLASMNQIAARIGSDPRLTPYALGQGKFSAFVAKTLLEYKAPGDYIHEMILYIRGGSMLYSSYSSYTTRSFANNAYRYLGWNESALTKDINTITANVLRPAETVDLGRGMTGRFITYMVPIPVTSSEPYATLIFLIQERDIAQTGSSGGKQGAESLLILDSRMRTIASLNPDSEPVHASGLLPFVREGGPQNSRRLSLNGKPYFVSYVKSELTGWTYVMTQPDDIVLKPVNDVKNEWLLQLAFVLVAGSLVVYRLWKMNYRPIGQLVSFVDARWGRKTKGANELESVRFVLSEMAESNVRLGGTLKRSERAIADHLLSRLLKGEFESKEQWNESGKEIGALFEHDRIGCMLLQAKGEPMPAASAIRSLLEEEMERHGMNGFVLDGMSPGQFTAAVAVEEGAAALLQWIDDLRCGLHARYGLALTAGVGRFYEDWKQAGKSYLEASTALECRLFRGHNKTISFEDQVVNPFVGRYPYGELERLEQLIREGNISLIKEMVHSIVQHIQHGDTTQYMARCLSYDIVNTSLKAMHKLSDGKPPSLARYPDVRSLMEFDTVEQLAEMVTDVCLDVCRAIGGRQQAVESGPIEAMLAYIERHYTDYDLSVQRMADDFSVSLSYLGRYFKEQTGRTIFDYIDERRIRHAKELLQTPDYTVKEIVRMIGYCDSSSFIRKFKRIVHLTPGEYRKLHSPASG